jgi:Uncharacterized protein conserved in bacteria (DUF2252)
MRHDLAATAAERQASGRAARKRVTRGTLGYWDEEERGQDALQTILAQNGIRVPGLLPIRHQRMAASPWNYYRGAAAVMAADLASQPGSGLNVQLCGDAHVLNFGLWATPERNLSFDLRDFDETLPGPFEWDVKRFAASLVVAARENRIKPARAAAAVTAGVDAYRKRMRRYATMPELDIWYDGTNADSLLGYFEPADRGRVSVHIEWGRRRRTSRGAFAKLVATATDIFVGWGSLHSRDYYVRQFRDMKIIPTTDLIAPRLAEFATACGETLARAHARTGDPVAIDSYIGKGRNFTAAISRFARAYADQNERDHAQPVSAIASGMVESHAG